MNCPWDAFEPATMSFCELPLCGFVVRPAETWTNGFYILVAAILFLLYRRDRDTTALWFSASAFSVGICSGLFHLTGTWVGEFLDIVSMYTYSCLLIAYAVRKLTSPAEAFAYYFVSLGLSILFLLAWHTIGVNLFIAHVVLWLSLELWWVIKTGWSKEMRHYYHPIFWLGAFFGVSYGVWWLDTLNIWCDPNNHFISGHATWHILNCWCFIWAYRMYGKGNKWK